MTLLKLSAHCQVLLVFLAYIFGAACLWRCRCLIWEEIRRVPRVYALGLLGLCLYQALFFVQVFKVEDSDRQYMYVDAARSILTEGSFGELQKSLGWAFLAFCGSFIFGDISSTTSLQILQTLGFGSIIGMFFLSLWAGLQPRGALICSVLFTIIPARFICLMTPTNQQNYLFFVIWAAAFSFLFYRFSSRDLFFLAGVFWILTVLARGESIGLFLLFITGVYYFVPREARKKLPWMDLLFVALMILSPLMIATVKHVFGGDRMPTQSQVGFENFFYNISHYGMDFLWGRAHPVMLTLFALIGGWITYIKDRKVFWSLSGWLLVLALTYFSMWLQVYGESKDFQIKMWILMFFYPPLLLFVAAGMLWIVDRYFASLQFLALFTLCGVLAFSFLLYYEEYFVRPNKSHALATAMSNVQLAVGCYSDAHMTDPLRANVLIGDSERRKRFFASARQFYLVESSEDRGDDACVKAIALVKEKGRAVEVQNVDQGNVKYKIYILSAF